MFPMPESDFENHRPSRIRIPPLTLAGARAEPVRANNLQVRPIGPGYLLNKPDHGQG